MSGEEPHRFLIHDHDSIYSDGVDRTVAAMGLTILKTPVRSPQANAFCERAIGTILRECLDWMIPFNERQLRRVLQHWVAHYNRGRPHTSLGSGIPDARPRGRDIWPSDSRRPPRRRHANSRRSSSRVPPRITSRVIICALQGQNGLETARISAPFRITVGH